MEWSIGVDIFNQVSNMTFVPNIDLFASRLNAKTDCFVSWHPEPGAIAQHLKTSKPGKSLEVKFMSLPEDPSNVYIR